MKVISTGATGMVGKSVLLACLEDKSITEVLLINRAPIDISNSKIVEMIVSSYEEIPTHEGMLEDVSACYHCMGVSAVGLSEERYNKFTFEYTKILADSVFEKSPNAVFTYVSGVGTDSSEKGNTMWARVKGKTENYILKKGFKDAYAFRPGAILPPKGVKSKTGWYNALYVIMRPFFPLMNKSKSVVTGMGIGRAMITLSQAAYKSKIINPSDINALGGKLN